MSGARIIFNKELTRVFKDKKLVFSLFILPAIIIIGMYSLIGNMTSNMVSDIEQHTSSVVIQNMPVSFKESLGKLEFSKNADITYIDTKTSTSEIENKILNKNIDLLIVFDENFLSDIKNYGKSVNKIPNIKLYYNSAADYSAAALNKFTSEVLEPMKRTLLAARIGNLEQLDVFHTEAVEIVDQEKKNGKMMAMLLPYMITFMLFVGAMSLCVDAITGEKERGTMAKLLLTPRNRSQIVIGKLLSLALLSSISAVIYALSMIVSLPRMSSELSQMGGKVHFNAVQIIELLIIMLAMVYMYVAIVSFVAVLAKTAKAASVYVSPIYTIIVVAGMLTMYQGGKEKPLYQFAIPVYGNAIAIQNIITNELTAAQFVIMLGSTVLVAALLTGGIARAFNNERLMFNA